MGKVQRIVHNIPTSRIFFFKKPRGPTVPPTPLAPPLYRTLLRYRYGNPNKVFVHLRSELDTPLDAIFTAYNLVVNSPTFVAMPSGGCDDHMSSCLHD